MNSKNMLIGLLVIIASGVYAAEQNKEMEPNADVVVFETPFFKIVTHFLPNGTRIIKSLNKNSGRVIVDSDTDHIIGLNGTSMVSDADWSRNINAERKLKKSEGKKGT